MARGRNLKLAAFAGLCFVQTAALARCAEEPQPPPAKPAPQPENQPEKQPESKPDPKPADTAPKPADATPAPKPADTVPAEPDPYTTPANPTLDKMDVTLAGKTFHLEQALTDEQRFHGLSGREEIASDGGMIFVFKQARRMEFVMRDCPADIDIIYVNPLGRITAMHHMAKGPRRTEEQRKLFPPYPDAPKWTWTNDSYEKSLRKYTSRYDACVVIELKGGTLKLSDTDPGTLVLKPNDKVMTEDQIKALQQKAE